MHQKLWARPRTTASNGSCTALYRAQTVGSTRTWAEAFAQLTRPLRAVQGHLGALPCTGQLTGWYLAACAALNRPLTCRYDGHRPLLLEGSARVWEPYGGRCAMSWQLHPRARASGGHHDGTAVFGTLATGFVVHDVAVLFGACQAAGPVVPSAARRVHPRAPAGLPAMHELVRPEAVPVGAAGRRPSQRRRWRLRRSQQRRHSCRHRRWSELGALLGEVVSGRW